MIRFQWKQYTHTGATLAMTWILGFMLSACSNGSGQTGNVYTPAPSDEEADSGVVYNGPSPTSADVQNFNVNLWVNIAGETRCGACHVPGTQDPSFARADDINLAYTQVNSVVNLNDPPSSRMVTKVSTGHGCWSDNSGFCVEKITEWITNWASQSGVELTQTSLRAPDIMDVSASLTYPEDTAAFQQHVYPLLSAYCSDCHRGDAPQAPVQPYFAATDVASAYLAAQTKMLFNTTETANGISIDGSRSRFVLRLREEAHNCWDNDCPSAANEMETALEAFAGTMQLRGLDSSLVTSKAMRIGDGTAISQGGRVETNAIAIYPFKAGKGTVASDYSDGFGDPLDLNLIGDVEWVSNWGVRINNGRVQGTTSASAKLARYIKQTGEYSVETWVVPANVTQDGPARIVSYSESNSARNFTLGQTLYNYDFFNRTDQTNANGSPLLSTPDADEVLQATLQHVVVSFDAIEGRKIYVNGDLVEAEDPAPGGNLNDWDPSFVLVLGNETSGEYPWRGTIRFLAIHNRALTAEQVKANYDVGVGQKILVAFSISHLISGMDDAYIVFQVEQFDDYSYLFNEPYFFSFTETPTTDIHIKGLRIGVNGREAKVGQAFANLDITINSSNFDPEGVPLSSLGTIIELEKGPEQDQFFLSFDSVDGVDTSREAVVIPAPAPAEDITPAAPRIGVRTFAEINASLSSMTGIPVTNADVASTFEAVKQQMPVNENVKGFLVAHQMGITQLAVKYCNVLANDNARMQSYFPNFSNNTFDTAGRNGLIDPLLQVLLAHAIPAEGQLNDQPLESDSKQRLNDLIDTMTAGCGGNVCNSTTATNTVTAVCAAALGSAVMLIQ